MEFVNELKIIQKQNRQMLIAVAAHAVCCVKLINNTAYSAFDSSFFMMSSRSCLFGADCHVHWQFGDGSIDHKARTA